MIEFFSFWNFNFAEGYGGAIHWNGNNGILKNCNFIKNNVKNKPGYASGGAAVSWMGKNGILTNSNFTNNTSAYDAGGVYWTGANGTLTSCIFTGNKSGRSGSGSGGAVHWTGANGTLTSCIFTGNKCGNVGGAIAFYSSNGILCCCIFTENTRLSSNNVGEAVFWNRGESIIDCNFNNNKWSNSNGIYALGNLTIIGGKGIINLYAQGTISGISIVVLNNETYYYPPNSNINFTK